MDKNSGLRPIGIAEVLRRIACKVVVSHIRELQVCAGQEAGGESLVHAMHEIYEDQSSENAKYSEIIGNFAPLI